MAQTPNHLTVPHEVTGYAYPFESAPSPGVISTESPAYNPEDLQKALQLPVIEVGGPTTEGFASLDGLTMKNPPIITNIYKPERNRPDLESEIRAKDLAVHALADVSNFPFAPNSAGVMLAAYLPRISHEFSNYTPHTIEAIRATGFPLAEDYTPNFQYGAPVQRYADMDAWIRRQDDSFLAMINNGASIQQLRLSEPARRCPRIALQVAACETLVDGGFLIMRGANQDDIERGNALGLTVQRVIYLEEDMTPERLKFEEVVFQKLSTASKQHS